MEIQVGQFWDWKHFLCSNIRARFVKSWSYNKYVNCCCCICSRWCCCLGKQWHTINNQICKLLLLLLQKMLLYLLLRKTVVHFALFNDSEDCWCWHLTWHLESYNDDYDTGDDDDYACYNKIYGRWKITCSLDGESARLSLSANLVHTVAEQFTKVTLPERRWRCW